MQIFLLICSGSILCLVVVLYFALRSIPKLRACLDAIKRKLMWNYFIRMTLESALEILLASMIRTYTLEFDPWHEALSSLYSIAALVFISLAVFVIPLFLLKRMADLRRQKFK